MSENRIKLNFSLNQENVIVQCPPGRRLIDIIRLDFGLTGTKEGCGKGECGSCLVLMNGDLVNSCLIPAFRLTDADIVTIEGLDRVKGAKDVRSLQEAIWPFQCGYCASGIKMALAALLLQNPQPTDEEIRQALGGNICRCCAYPAILKGVKQFVRYPKKRRHARS